MHDTNERVDQALVDEIQRLHREISRAQRELFRLLVEADRREIWRESGARDTAHWLSMSQGISAWKARRWLAAAHALETLPAVSDALETGDLGVDKATELARFATFETEDGLIRWAQRVSVWGVRRRADLETRRTQQDVTEVERSRSLSWWYFDDGRRFGLEGQMPAADGAVVARALERVADRIPVMPGEHDEVYADARRADALVALASAGLGRDDDLDRATVVVHAPLDALEPGDRGAEIEGGGVVPPQTARRLLCHSRVQAVLEDGSGQPVRIGRLRREPPAWMLRQLRYRDRECTFPGCGARRFTQAHHIVWWEQGGGTDLDNLLLVCGFHHKLVHEYGWTVRRDGDGPARWFRPDGSAFGVGAGPPAEDVA